MIPSEKTTKELVKRVEKMFAVYNDKISFKNSLRQKQARNNEIYQF